MKKILSITLVLTLLLGALCIFPASAEHISAHKINCGDFWYVPLSDNTAAIGAVSTDLSGAVVIPETIDGYTVTEIADNGFSEAKITDITIPNTVTRLGEYSFSYCPNLKTVNISNSVTTIDYCAFANCPKLTYMFVPDSVTFIGEAAIGYEDNYVDNDGVMLPDGGYVRVGQMVIEGYKGTAAAKYANENHISFKGVALYKDKVLALLNIPEEDPGTGDGWLDYYSEEYYYYSTPDEIGEATPDFVLIKAYENIMADCEITERFGDYVLHSSDLKYPGEEFGYHIYLPDANEVYTITEAFEKGISDVYSVFTEGIIGELIGDVNYDGKLNIKDATLIQKDLAGIDKIYRNEIDGFTWSEDENVPLYIGDYNRDGKMNIRDATAIQKHLAGLDARELEYTVLEIRRVTTASNYNNIKTVARNRTELKNALAKITETVGPFEPDEKFTDEYFEENSVIVIADIIGGSCCSQLIDNVKTNGTTLTVSRFMDYHEVHNFDINYQLVLIEAKKDSLGFVSDVGVVDLYVLVCY